MLNWRAPSAQAATGGSRAVGAAARTVSLDQDWLFGGDYAEGSELPGFDDAWFNRVTLPHTVTELPWQEWEPARWEKRWIYRRHFDVPEELSGLRLFLDFDGALTGTRATLNGKLLGEYLGGYLPFSYEITEAVRSRGNVLGVVLDSGFNINVPPNRPAPTASTSVDFWQPGGIYRQVRLRAVPQLFLADVFAKPVNVLDAAERRVEVECTVDAAMSAPDGTQIVVDLRDGDRKIASAKVPVTIGKPGRTTVTATLTGLGDIKLWDVDDPNLYTVVATLTVDGAPVHDHQVRTGFREARFTKTGFFLNGRRIKLFGVNRHQFFPYAGGAMSDRVQRKDAEILRRDLNCNMVRCSHYPQARAFLDACDELGLLVWEEAAGWGFIGNNTWKDLAVRDVGEMVRRDRNHPSIIIWGARLNETADDVAFYTRTRDVAHALDDSRPTAGAMAGRHDTQNYVQDVFAQNDYSKSTGPDGKQQPELMSPRTDRPYLVTEAIGTLSGPAKFYRRTETQAAQQGQATAHGRVHNIAAADDRHCGVLAWCGYDYPSGSGNQYKGVKYPGIVDLFRIPKPGAAIYQSQVDPKTRPVIQPAFYWDFGPTSPVTSLSSAMICANLDRLEIYVGGAHHATVTPDTTNYGHLPYPPSFVDFSKVDGSSHPELRVDGYLGDSLVASRKFSADTSRDRLSVSADDAEISADGSDTTRVVFRAADQHGAARPYVDGDVTVTVDGPGELIGDRKFPFAEAGGAGAVWIRSRPHRPGKIHVTVSHPTLGSETVTIGARQVAPGGTPPVDVTLAVTTSPRVVRTGDRVRVTATLTNRVTPALEDVTFALQAPDGWPVSPSGSRKLRVVNPRETVEVSWELAAPEHVAGEETLAVKVTYTANDRPGGAHATTTLLAASSLAAAFNNAGVTDDSDVDTASFDSVGDSYSAQLLAAAGISPGAAVEHKGLTFTWPDVAVGQPNNVVAQGQTITLSGAGTKLGVLGAGSGGNFSGAITVHYSDGTSSSSTLMLGDWWNGPIAGNDSVASMPYVNSQGIGGRERGQRQHAVYVFSTEVPVTPGKQVAAVTLPTGGTVNSTTISGMHIFALAIG
ncbi:glycoside hydrolase family 2 TIM barrel-domain containing protein [Streptomyces sp. NPDC058424]|uniref:glycoside hydrolase family 2 TIM barrel-domain containing protein n=1 Tax=Streptomyces sp. NPDC058424 TaxID=3346491 RepID=UPI00366608FB